jgi:CRP/FNR family transcriptional regulator
MPMNTDIGDVLSRTAFFKELSPGARERLAGVCRARHLRKKEILFREEERGHAMFLLEEGRIRLHKTTADGDEVVIRTIKPGETFGEVVLFEEDRYPVTAMALTPATVLAFARDDIRLLLGYSEFRDDFIAMLMRKQRYLAERVRLLTAHDVEERFALFLKEQYGEQPRLTTMLSKKDIAAAIGATPETLSRLLRRLKKQKKLQWSGRTLTLRPDFWKSGAC